MAAQDIVIEETNLSTAWLTAVGRIVNGSGMEITPLVLSLTNFNETPEVRAAVDAELKAQKMGSIQTVSETIFPDSLYKYCGEDRHELYKEYLNNVPRIRKIDSSNHNGTYFERLIAFDGKKEKINQLEIIISSLDSSSKVRRRSKLQASIFDPNVDHTNGMFQGFPCLQHVTFAQSENGGLILTSFYAIQYLFRRAYGNWLGLINLGKFVANELDVKFEKMVCCVGVEHLDMRKSDAKKFLETIEETV